MRRLLLLAALLCALPVRAQIALPPELLDGAAGLLAQWIDTSRDTTVRQGVRPMPAPIERALLGYFPPSLLSRVRYGVGSAGGFALPALVFQYGDAAALTLGDVIMFHDSHGADADLKLWAHELTHVQQYQRWGVRGFAARYVRDPASVEREAYANADRFAIWHDSNAH